MIGHPAAWTAEIRDYLLGRLAKGQESVTLGVPQSQRLLHAPIRRWWIFEGKRYASINGTLASSWTVVTRAVRLLERTFNPRLKTSERPEGTIDWGHTFARGPSGPRAEYVLRSSGVGLGEDEHAALCGWMRWLFLEWTPYAARFGLPMPAVARQSFEALAAKTGEADITIEQLRRWVHVARRSRWPLLRDLVAESLRASLEADALDHIPLPSDRAVLFELLCLVRIARLAAPPPREIRWLDSESTRNMLSLVGMTCWYQQSLEREAVLGTPEFGHRLAEAAPVFDLRVPKLVDLAFELDPPLRGISGIIVEAKSGSQGFNETVAQLRIYRRARGRRAESRYLVWGIVEDPERGEITEAQLDWVRREVDTGMGDVWVFSGAESIDAVLAVLGCSATDANASLQEA